MLGEKLKQLRKTKGISQEVLSLKLNVVRQTISKWEKGISVPDADMLVKIASVLGTSVNELQSEAFNKKEDKNPMNYDVIIIGAGPGGIFASYELMQHQPELNATPGDLSLVLPKRLLDGIIEMIYALDKVAPGTANDDTLLYGVEVKFYNMEVEVNEKLESRHPGLYIIGDGSGITHSLSHASASGVHVARDITAK